MDPPPSPTALPLSIPNIPYTCIVVVTTNQLMIPDDNHICLLKTICLNPRARDWYQLGGGGGTRLNHSHLSSEGGLGFKHFTVKFMAQVKRI